MEWWEVLLIVGLFVLVAAVFALVAWGFIHVRKRDGRSDQQQAELVQFVAGRGWSYNPVVRGGGDRYCGTAPFPLAGDNIDICDHITGEFRGRSFSCFEYRKRDGGTDTNRQWRFYTVCAVTMPTSVPRVSVNRPGPMERLDARMFAGMRGAGQVVQVGIPEFDKEFLTTADDESFAREVLAGQPAQFLLADPRAKDAPVQFHGNELITWYQGRLRPEKLDPQLNYLCDLLDRLPEQAWRPA